MNKKMIMAAVLVAVMSVGSAFAAPKPPPGGRPGGHRPPAVKPHNPPPRHNSGSFWGKGGRNFWPGFVGGVVGGALASRPAPPPPPPPRPVVVAPAPVVVAPAPVVVSPTYVTQKVWVEGHYAEQVLSNGTVIRVWQPGRYEYRQVLVQ